MQNNILEILKENPLIPVVTISHLNEIDKIYIKLKSKNVRCIEITLRTPVSREAVKIFKERYGDDFKVGVGTIVSVEDVQFCVENKVDFMVSPGLAPAMIEPLESSGIPFIPGVSTPSEIMSGLECGWSYFKFFPANLFGGVDAMKTYSAIFPNVLFCPTGGINERNYKDFLRLDNVISVGGSWLNK
ncbi:MAG: 2-dehydro-3-deoxyphosphogluconate aldolase/(4S)-4-hydroxy-2-oxoglutarate aldolase [Crocinitomix sp.]|jgi:2-dehydro-3-deoxyphosphogluconate aldolase/(4S)-4-hydroxy-2-oxoglutarate aldolase